MTNREIQALYRIAGNASEEWFKLDCEDPTSAEFGKAIDDIRKIYEDAFEAEKRRRQEAKA